MTIDSLETLLLTCIFVAPGFLIDGIVNIFSPSGKRNEGVHFLYCLLYSAIHCAVCSWAYILVWDLKESKITYFLLAMCGIALAGAITLGILIGIFKSKAWIRRFLRKCKCNVSMSIPTAWDDYFAKQIASYVIVTLQDDSKIYGYFGSDSFASSEADERDIFVEKLYRLDDNKNWTEIPGSLGVLLQASQIKTIEFLQGGQEGESENNGD